MKSDLRGALAKHWRAVVAVLALSTLYGVLGHLDFWPGDVWGLPRGFEFNRPTLTSGDEPHYLMVVNSLLTDQDIRLDADYERIRTGGADAGRSFRGTPLGGHSFLVDPKTNRHVLCIVRCEEADVAKLGGMRDDLFQVPAHPAAYPALMALMVAGFRPSTAEVEGLVGRMSILLSIIGVVLTYACARWSGLAKKQAFAAAGILAVASPWVVYIRSYFTETAIGVFLLLAFLTFRQGRMVAAGIAISVAMAIKAPFVLVGFAWIIERGVARRFRDAIVLAVAVGICGLAFLAVNLVTLRMPLAGGALPFEFAAGFQTLRDTLFDQHFGVCLFAPWTAIAIAWGLRLLFQREKREQVTLDLPPEDDRGRLDIAAARQMMLPTLAYLAVVVSMGFGPGWCFGPRYCIPVLPFFAIIAIDFAWSGARWRRVGVGVLAVAGALVALPSTPQYHTAFGRPPHYALLKMVAPRYAPTDHL